MKNIILLAIFIGFSNIVLADNKEKSIEVKSDKIVEVTNTPKDVEMKTDTTSLYLIEASKETTRLVDEYVDKYVKKMLLQIEEDKKKNRK